MPAVVGVHDLNRADLWTEQRDGGVQVRRRLTELDVFHVWPADELHLSARLWCCRMHHVRGHVVQKGLGGFGIHPGDDEFWLPVSGQANRIGSRWIDPVAFDELNCPAVGLDQLPHVCFVVGLGGLWVIASPAHISSPVWCWGQDAPGHRQSGLGRRAVAARGPGSSCNGSGTDHTR